MNKKSIIPYMSWSALYAGAITGVGLNFLMNLLVLGLGIATFSVNISGQTNFSGAGFSCFIISALIAMFCTGWVAGKLTPPILEYKAWGLLYGFLSWSLLLIFTIILLLTLFSMLHSTQISPPT
jgi:hypothetical protein